MPTYQYACTACGHQLEAVQSFADEPLTQCPSCEGRLRKVFNSVGIVFKGSGFYRTDSRKGESSSDKAPAKSTATKNGSDSATSSGSSSSGGSDSSSGGDKSGSGSAAKSTTSSGSGGTSGTSTSTAA